MPYLSGAEALITSLANEGVEVIFGLPGVQIMDAVDAIYRDRSIRWISTRHEQTAAYMAYGYARTTGKIGVAMVLPGPGALNTAAAVGTAVVSLFAPVVPAQRWAPYGVPVALLGDQRAACRGTRVRECVIPGHPCLSDVDPQTVRAAVDALTPALEVTR